MEKIIVIVCCVGVVMATINKTSPEDSLRKSLHRPALVKTPANVDEALIVKPGADTSYFQKLPGKYSKKQKAGVGVGINTKTFCPFFSGSV